MLFLRFFDVFFLWVFFFSLSSFLLFIYAWWWALFYIAFISLYAVCIYIIYTYILVHIETKNEWASEYSREKWWSKGILLLFHEHEHNSFKPPTAAEEANNNNNKNILSAKKEEKKRRRKLDSWLVLFACWILCYIYVHEIMYICAR